MNDIKKIDLTSIIYSSKLNLYKAELIKVNNNIYKSTTKKRELESLINEELPTERKKLMKDIMKTWNH